VKTIGKVSSAIVDDAVERFYGRIKAPAGR
jgi:hypothetical protein